MVSNLKIPFTVDNIKEKIIFEGVRYFVVTRNEKRVRTFLILRKQRIWYMYQSWTMLTDPTPVATAKTRAELKVKVLEIVNGKV